MPTGRYTAIAAGRAHTCGINLQQKVVCWGDNGAGQSMPPVTGTGVPVDTGLGHRVGLVMGDEANGSQGGGKALGLPLVLFGLAVGVGVGVGTCAAPSRMVSPSAWHSAWASSLSHGAQPAGEQRSRR